LTPVYVMKENKLATTPEQAKKTAIKALKELLTKKVVTPEESSSKTLAALDKYGVAAVEQITVINPITKKEVKMELRRDGTPESELILALLDTKKTQDQKDFVLSMYFWGRGSESVSMMVDLMRYKGEHTKETRVFKSQMRVDFEAFVTMFTEHLEQQALTTATILDIDLKKEIIGFKEFLSLPNNKNKNLTFWDYVCNNETKFSRPLIRLEAAMISQAIFQLDEAERLRRARQNITLAREREKGKGIYVSGAGKVYSVDDPLMDDVVKQDREETSKIERE
jgi:hypothetical protein